MGITMTTVIITLTYHRFSTHINIIIHANTVTVVIDKLGH